MFKFLKLRNSVSGDARRHVPFRSIIHKPLFILIVLVFSFVAIVPIKVKAAAPQLHPEFKPILDTDIVNFQDSYLNLDPAAQTAASILFGAYVTEYAGLADYGAVFDSIPTEGDIWDRLEYTGQQFIDLFFLPYNMADQLVLTPLLDLGQGIINKVKGVTDIHDFKSSIMNSGSYGLYYSPDIGFALNQTLAREGGLFNWQYHDVPYSSLSQFVWDITSANISSSESLEYSDQLVLISYPVKVNYLSVYKNCIVDLNGFKNYHNLFINLSSNRAYLCDDNGNMLPQYPYQVNARYTSYNNNGEYNGGSYDFYSIGYQSYNPSLSLDQNVFNLINSVWIGSLYFNIADLVQNIFYGNDWHTRSLYKLNSDLGFTDTDSLQVLNPIEETVFDIKALIEQIVQAQPDPAYELPLKPIIYNITQVNGNPLTAEDLQGISFNVTPPESGIDVPTNVFLPFFDNGKGFISYMWYMTKPLVMYTRSFLDAITFDPAEGFNATGPGYFILGVAGLGLIGGVIVKFLL